MKLAQALAWRAVCASCERRRSSAKTRQNCARLCAGQPSPHGNRQGHRRVATRRPPPPARASPARRAGAGRGHATRQRREAWGEATQLHVFFELGDHLGSTSVVLDKATGELVERSTYQAYGGTESDYRPERWKSFREDYRFTGKEEDVEVGLIYFGYRFLNPLLNRWVSADPLTIHQLGADANLYAYVSGRALQSVDPLGLDDAENAQKDTDRASSLSDREVDGIFCSSDSIPSCGAGGLDAGQAPEPESPKKSLRERRQERWNAAKRGAWDAAVDANTSEMPTLGAALQNNFAGKNADTVVSVVGGLIREWASAGPGQNASDEERESYQFSKNGAAFLIVALGAAAGGLKGKRGVKQGGGPTNPTNQATRGVNTSGSAPMATINNPLKANKNFFAHFRDHAQHLARGLGGNVRKWKDGGGEDLLNLLSTAIHSGKLKLAGRVQIHTKNPNVYNAYQGGGQTVLVDDNGFFVTGLKQGKGMDKTLVWISKFSPTAVPGGPTNSGSGMVPAK